MKRHCFTAYPLFALIGLILLPLAVVHASPSFDYEQWRRDHPRPAGKAIQNRNRGESRTVRMIYFLPNDRPYRQDVVDEMKVMMRRVQTFYAEQRQVHGHGNTTFRIETDGQGEPLVHRVDGQHPEKHYDDNDTITEVLDEIYFGEGPLQFDILANDYLIVIDNSTGTIDVHGYKAGGVNSDFGKRGGITLVPNYLNFGTIAHELGHTFGLIHDFRDDAYIMSYGGNPDRLSACAAEFLSVHPYFNADISLGGEDIILDEGGRSSHSQSFLSVVEMISPDYPAGAKKVPIQLKISDAQGLHQVLLIDIERNSDTNAAGLGGVVACRELNGEKDTVVEFEYDVSIPPFRWEPRPGDPEYHDLWIRTVSVDGLISEDYFPLLEASSYYIASLGSGLGYVHELSFSPDGSLLAIAGSEEVSLWDVESRKQVASLGQRPGALSFSPDGSLLAISDSEGVSLWDVESRKQVASFGSGLGYVGDLSFSPDGSLLAIAGSEEVSLWDVESRKQVASFGQWPGALSFSPDGSLLAIADSEGVSLWDVESRKQVASFGQWPGALSFSPDGSLLAIMEGEVVRLWNVASKKQVASFAYPGSVPSVSFSPDGGTLAAGGTGGTVRLWDVSEWIGEQAVVAAEEQDPAGEIADDESSGEDQPESGEQPTSAVELKDISASHDSVGENDGQATTITLTVTLDKVATTDETITLTLVSPLVGKTAQRGEDFDAILAETLTIAKGQRTGTAQLVLTPKDNTTAEGDKALAVQATSSSGHAALVNIKIIDNDAADEPQARLTPDPSEVAFSADDPAWKTFTVHTNLDSVLVRANPSGSDPALEVAGGQQVPTRDYCPAEGNDRPTRGRRDGWDLHVKACQAGQTKILLIDYDTGAVVQQYEVNVEGTGVAATMALNPSYPNPFNSETVLSYTLPTASDIRLEVFTLSGQRVAVLHEGFQAAGYHRLHWDGRDTAGRPVASGTYLYRLVTDETVLTRKLTLLR